MNWRERAHRLRAVPLIEVLPLCGARPDPEDRCKWHTAQGVLTVTGAKFMNWHCGRGGGGAIDLVMHLQQLAFGQALEWLENHFGTATFIPTTASPQPPLSLPPPCPQRLEQVRRYLIQDRRLPPALLEPLLRSGDLYADARANAVFLLRGKLGQTVGAELRGTTASPWQGMAPGSRKDQGFFAIPAIALHAIVLCESAIDAISCHALYPHYRCLSTAGARPNPAWLAELVDPSHQLYCGFDLDDTGETMACSMIALHPSIHRLRPTRKDWNDVLRAKSAAA
jgi:hypothetical protein